MLGAFDGDVELDWLANSADKEIEYVGDCESLADLLVELSSSESDLVKLCEISLEADIVTELL